MVFKKGNIEEKEILKEHNNNGLKIVFKTEEYVDIIQDHSLKIKDVNHYGRLKIKNPSTINRIWDIGLSLKNTKDISFESENIFIRNLNITESENVHYQKFDITKRAKNLLLVKEYINTSSDANKILKFDDITSDLIKLSESNGYSSSNVLESTKVSINKENRITFVIGIKSLDNQLIKNISVKKRIIDNSKNLIIEEVTDGNVEIGKNELEWKINDLNANSIALLKFSVSLFVNIDDKINTGSIEVEYEGISSIDLQIEKYNAYTDNSHYLEIIEKDESPGVWEIKLVIENISEFLIDLIDVNVNTYKDQTLNFVNLDSNSISRLSAGAIWQSKPWLIESDEYPNFKKNVDFRIVPHITFVLKGSIKLGEVVLETSTEDLVKISQDWIKKAEDFKQQGKYYEAILSYEKSFELNPNYENTNILRLSQLVSGNFPIPILGIFEQLKNQYDLELGEEDFDWLIESNFDGYAVGIDPVKNPEDWIYSKVIVPWNVIVFYVNQKIDGVPESYPDRLYFKDIRNSLFFPDHSLVGFAKQKQLLQKFKYILEECNNRGYFSRYVNITEDSIEIPVLDEHNILYNLQNLTKKIDSNFKSYITSLSKEIMSKMDNFLFDIKNSVKEPLLKLIQAHRDKLLPEIIEIHIIDKDDWNYFKSTYEGWKKLWTNLKSSLKLTRITVLVFQCSNPQCGRTFRFLYLQETKFSKISKIILKVIPWASKLINFEMPIELQLPEVLKRPEIHVGSKKRALLPDEITFLYQTLIGIEDEDSTTLANTFIFNKDSLDFRCNKCFKEP